MARRPPLFIVLHHSVSPETTTVEEIRRWHLSRGFRDIGYQYVVRKSSAGWQVEPGRPEDAVGAHCKGWNDSTVGVCVCGDYTQGPLSDGAMAALLGLLRPMLQRYGMTERQVMGHGQMTGQATLCPGFDVDSVRAALLAG